MHRNLSYFRCHPDPPSDRGTTTKTIRNLEFYQIKWRCVTYLRRGAQWRGEAGLFTPSLSRWASHPHVLRGCLCRRGAACLFSHPLSSLLSCHPALCLSDDAAAAAPAQTCGGSCVAPQRQDWVGYILALMPGPYGWHVIGKSHHMRAGDWHAAAFTETGFPWGRRTRHLSHSWKRKWNKDWMAQKAASVSLHLWEKRG